MIRVLFTSSLFFIFINLSIAQNKDFKMVESILKVQSESWNKGDIDGFMQTYWKSDNLQFIGSQGVTYGWQNTLEGYKKRYPDKKAMGKLTFEIKDMTQHSRKVVSLTGSWALEREKDNPGGHFLLIWRKIKGQWRIVADHTSSRN